MRTGLTATLCSGALLVALSGVAFAAEFSADVVERSSGSVRNGRLYVQGVRTRQDTVVDGATQITISRPDKGTVWVTDSTSRLYVRYATPKLTRPAAPKWGELSKKLPTVKRLSTETVSGYSCDKYRISLDTKAVKLGYVLSWVSKKLGRELKVERNSPDGRSTMELLNIREARLPGSTFEIPSGYTERKLNPMPKSPGAHPGK